MDKQARILAILRAITQQDVSPDPDQSLFESGILDSFALPDLMNALEREFSICIPDSDLNPRKFESLARIESYIERHV